MITADEARFLMGGISNTILIVVEGQIRRAAMEGYEFIVRGFNPNEYDVEYIRKSFENRGFVVEVDKAEPGPDTYLRISW